MTVDFLTVAGLAVDAGLAATSVGGVVVFADAVVALLLLVGDGVAASLAEGWPSDTVSGTD